MQNLAETVVRYIPFKPAKIYTEEEWIAMGFPPGNLSGKKKMAPQEQNQDLPYVFLEDLITHLIKKRGKTSKEINALLKSHDPDLKNHEKTTILPLYDAQAIDLVAAGKDPLAALPELELSSRSFEAEEKLSSTHYCLTEYKTARWMPSLREIPSVPDIYLSTEKLSQLSGQTENRIRRLMKGAKKITSGKTTYYSLTLEHFQQLGLAFFEPLSISTGLNPKKGASLQTSREDFSEPIDELELFGRIPPSRIGSSEEFFEINELELFGRTPLQPIKKRTSEPQIAPALEIQPEPLIVPLETPSPIPPKKIEPFLASLTEKETVPKKVKPPLKPIAKNQEELTPPSKKITKLTYFDENKKSHELTRSTPEEIQTILSQGSAYFPPSLLERIFKSPRSDLADYQHLFSVPSLQAGSSTYLLFDQKTLTGFLTYLGVTKGKSTIHPFDHPISKENALSLLEDLVLATQFTGNDFIEPEKLFDLLQTRIGPKVSRQDTQGQTSYSSKLLDHYAKLYLQIAFPESTFTPLEQPAKPQKPLLSLFKQLTIIEKDYVSVPEIHQLMQDPSVTYAQLESRIKSLDIPFSVKAPEGVLLACINRSDLPALAKSYAPRKTLKNAS